MIFWAKLGGIVVAASLIFSSGWLARGWYEDSQKLDQVEDHEEQRREHNKTDFAAAGKRRADRADNDKRLRDSIQEVHADEEDDGHCGLSHAGSVRLNALISGMQSEPGSDRREADAEAD